MWDLLFKFIDGPPKIQQFSKHEKYIKYTNYYTNARILCENHVRKIDNLLRFLQKYTK